MMTKYSLVYATTRSDGTAVRMKAQALEDDGKTPILHGTPDLIDVAVTEKEEIEVDGEDGKKIKVSKDVVRIVKRPQNRPPVEAEHEVVSPKPLLDKAAVLAFVKAQKFADALDAKLLIPLTVLGKAPKKPGVNLGPEGVNGSDIK